MESLKKVKSRIRKAVDLWLSGDKAKWRQVYKDNQWDTKYWKRGLNYAYKNSEPGMSKLFKDFLKKGRTYSWYGDRVEDRMLGFYDTVPPPLPDWGGKGKDTIISPLADPKNKEYYKKEILAQKPQTNMGKLRRKMLSFMDPSKPIDLVHRKDKNIIEIVDKNKNVILTVISNPQGTEFTYSTKDVNGTHKVKFKFEEMTKAKFGEIIANIEFQRDVYMGFTENALNNFLPHFKPKLVRLVKNKIEVFNTEGEKMGTIEASFDGNHFTFYKNGKAVSKFKFGYEDRKQFFEFASVKVSPKRKKVIQLAEKIYKMVLFNGDIAVNNKDIITIRDWAGKEIMTIRPNSSGTMFTYYINGKPKGNFNAKLMTQEKYDKMTSVKSTPLRKNIIKLLQNIHGMLGFHLDIRSTELHSDNTIDILNEDNKILVKIVPNDDGSKFTYTNYNEDRGTFTLAELGQDTYDQMTALEKPKKKPKAKAEKIV